MGFAYSNNGMTFRAWNSPSGLLPGEVYFAGPPDALQLGAAFPAYGTIPLAQQAAAALAAGLSIALSGSLTLAATTFPTDPTTTGKIAAVVTTLLATGAFPGGATSYPMKDVAGTWHSFTAGQYTKVAGALAAYVAALDLIQDGNPLDAAALPPAAISLAV